MLTGKLADLTGPNITERWGVTGTGLVVSRWHTESGRPYRAMQFKAPVKDTTTRPGPKDPINL
jgi:hypothetical protein